MGGGWFRFSGTTIDPDELRRQLDDPAAGALTVFEGRVRNRNDGRSVVRLEYQAYETLGIREGEKIIAEARERFPILGAACIHRTGLLEIGEMAVWVGVASAHRDAAFAACRYIIDEVKDRVPIWKKEHYLDGASNWINCAPRAPDLAGTGS